MDRRNRELGTSIKINGQVTNKLPKLKFIEIIDPEVPQGGRHYATVKVHQAHPIMSLYQNGAGRAQMSRLPRPISTRNLPMANRPA